MLLLSSIIAFFFFAQMKRADLPPTCSASTNLALIVAKTVVLFVCTCAFRATNDISRSLLYCHTTGCLFQGAHIKASFTFRTILLPYLWSFLRGNCRASQIFGHTLSCVVVSVCDFLMPGYMRACYESNRKQSAVLGSW